MTEETNRATAVGGDGLSTGAPPETADPGTTANVFEDLDAPILPEGWKEGDAPPLSVPDLNENSGNHSGASENPDAAPPAAGEGTEEHAPAPETPAGSGGNGGQDASSTPDAAQTPEPDYKALYERELDRQNAEKFRQMYRHLTETENMPDAVAKMAAAYACGGKSYPLEEGADSGGAGPGGASPDPGGQDFGARIHQIHQMFPDAREMPSEVSEAVMRGADPVSAYTSYRVRQSEAEIAALRRENETLRQNLSNMERTPVRGVSGGGVKQEPENDFLRGFDAEWK